MTTSFRLHSINIIAGISSQGELYYTVNQGKTNATTFIHFMVKLCSHLNSMDRRWRANTVIMLDNAPYHRAAVAREKLKLLKVPLLYLGPYQFKMAPIEIFFSYIKAHDLNPLKTKVPSA